MISQAFPSEYFHRYDDTDDHHFYNVPRKVVHIDDGAIAALTDVYRGLLPRGGAILDLMSSWRSHLPPELNSRRVAGLGMNADEMADNPQLTEFSLQNLNQQPHLPYSRAEFDAAVCAVSVQYLTRPVEVFAEVARVLRPGSPFIVSFSNRCFPTKAVAIWQASSDSGHMALVTRYFDMAAQWTGVQAQVVRKPNAIWSGDPLYIVWGCRI